MPADTSATRYEWYWDVPENERLVRFIWAPDEEFASSMTMGLLTLEANDEGLGAWAEIHNYGQVPWVVAQKVARNEHFVVEVAKHDES